MCGVKIDNFYIEFASQDTLRLFSVGDEVTVTGFLGDATCAFMGVDLWLENGPTSITKAK